VVELLNLYKKQEIQIDNEIMVAIIAMQDTILNYPMPMRKILLIINKFGN